MFRQFEALGLVTGADALAVPGVGTRQHLLIDHPADARQAAHPETGSAVEFAAVLWCEGLFLHFDNRRRVAAYAGLALTP